MQDELQEAQAQVLKKIGANIVLYQYYETSLKLLLIKANTSGYLSNFKEHHSKCISAISKQTMGGLTTSFVNQILSESGITEEKNGPSDLTEVWFSLSTKIKFEDDKYIERKKNILAELVAERNDLVHHFLAKNSL